MKVLQGTLTFLLLIVLFDLVTIILAELWSFIANVTFTDARFDIITFILAAHLIFSWADRDQSDLTKKNPS